MSSHLSAPLEAFLAITNRCNLACAHCNVRPTRQEPDLSLEKWAAIIGRLAQLKVFRLWISGGEPLMRPDFFELLEIIEQTHFFYGLNTNAMLVDDEKAARLASLGRLRSVVVSLEGHNAQVHGRLRGEASFGPAVAGIRALVRRLGQLETYTTVTRTNFRHLKDIVRFALELGVTSVKFNELLPLGQGFKLRAELTLTNEERRQTFAEAARLNEKYPGVLAGSYVEMGPFFEGLGRVAASGLTPGPSRYLSSCEGGITKLTIRPDGKVVPCDRLWDFVAGDLTTQDLAEIWHESKVFEQMRARQTTRLDQIADCAGCPVVHMCTGGCPAVSFRLHQDVFRPDPLSCYQELMRDGYPYELA